MEKFCNFGRLHHQRRRRRPPERANHSWPGNKNDFRWGGTFLAAPPRPLTGCRYFSSRLHSVDGCNFLPLPKPLLLTPCESKSSLRTLNAAISACVCCYGPTPIHEKDFLCFSLLVVAAAAASVRTPKCDGLVPNGVRVRVADKKLLSLSFEAAKAAAAAGASP